MLEGKLFKYSFEYTFIQNKHYQFKAKLRFFSQAIQYHLGILLFSYQILLTSVFNDLKQIKSTHLLFQNFSASKNFDNVVSLLFLISWDITFRCCETFIFNWRTSQLFWCFNFFKSTIQAQLLSIWNELRKKRIIL